LPYVSAFSEESQRWHPVLVMGIAHAAFEDDVYEGFFIPKGSVVVGHAFDILHDETVYGQDKDKFRPERFLNSGVGYPLSQWGFGRRMCPGRYLANGNLFLATATILKLFDVLPAKDKDGKDIPVYEDFVGVGNSQPAPFKCLFKPRSEYAKNLLESKNPIS
ncbi:hypothetical protein M422DRAFT_190267, partial [Sphaerobolus stellatus SS14]